MGHLMHDHKGILTRRRIISLRDKRYPSRLIPKTIVSSLSIDLLRKEYVGNPDRLTKNILLRRRLHDHVDLNLTVPEFPERPLARLQDLKIEILSLKMQINKLRGQMHLDGPTTPVVS